MNMEKIAQRIITLSNGHKDEMMIMDTAMPCADCGKDTILAQIYTFNYTCLECWAKFWERYCGNRNQEVNEHVAKP